MNIFSESKERFEMFFPREARKAAALLMKRGYEAYFVGGCVRDFIMGRSANDFDLTTNAKSGDIIGILSECGFDARLIGGSCGTVGVQAGTFGDKSSEQIEITPYRCESGYTDHRHPSQVKFVNSLEEDLKRRDFTVNSLAAAENFDGDVNILDYFGGKKDIEKKIIRCVGNPSDRFEEDALRILRALRFSAELSFNIENKTAQAIIEKRELIKYISGERKVEELRKLLKNGQTEAIFHEFYAVFSEIVGNFAENGIDSVKGGFCEKLFYILRFRPLGEFKKIISELKISSSEKSSIAEYKKIFDFCGGAVTFENIFQIISRHGYFAAEYLKIFGEYESFSHIFEDKAIPKTVSELAVSGEDMRNAGFCGAEIGKALKTLLISACSGKVKNDRETLLKYVKDIKDGIKHE